MAFLSTNFPYIGVALQPIFLLGHDNDPELSGFEVLAREKSHAPDGTPSLTSPENIISFCPEVDFVALEKICFFKEYSKSHYLFNVNFSHKTLAQNDCVQKISDILHQHSVPHQKIGIEILEEPFGDQKEKILNTIRLLAEKGHPIFIDDFGIDHSNINRVATIKNLIRHTGEKLTVKIDGSLTKEAERDEDFSFLEHKDFEGVNLVFEHASNTIEQSIPNIRKLFMEEIKVQSYAFGEPLSLTAANDLIKQERKQSPQIPRHQKYVA